MDLPMYTDPFWCPMKAYIPEAQFSAFKEQPMDELAPWCFQLASGSLDPKDGTYPRDACVLNDWDGNHLGRLLVYLAEFMDYGKLSEHAVYYYPEDPRSMQLHYSAAEYMLGAGCELRLPDRLPVDPEVNAANVCLMLSAPHYPQSTCQIKHAAQRNKSFRACAMTLCCIRLVGGEGLATALGWLPNELLFEILSWIPFSYVRHRDAWMKSQDINEDFGIVLTGGLGFAMQ